MGGTEVEVSVRERRVPPPRWAVVFAWIIPFCVLPSGIWRLAFAWNFLAEGAPPMGPSLAEHIYVPALSFVSVGLAALSLGLVQRWGERVPGWVPFVGGRPVPIKAAVVPAAAGGTMVTLLCVYALLNAHFHWVTRVKPLIGEDRAGPGITGDALTLGIWAYMPILLWGPLLLALTVSYHRRRTTESARVSGGRAAAMVAR